MCLWMYGGQQRHQVALSVTLHLIVWDGVSPCMWRQQSAGPADQPPGLSSLHLCLTLCPTLDPRAREQRFMLVKQARPPYLLLTSLPTGLLSSKLAPKKIVLSPWGVWVIKELTYGLARVTVSWPYMQQPLCGDLLKADSIGLQEDLLQMSFSCFPNNLAMWLWYSCYRVVRGNCNCCFVYSGSQRWFLTYTISSLNHGFSCGCCQISKYRVRIKYIN